MSKENCCPHFHFGTISSNFTSFHWFFVLIFIIKSRMISNNWNWIKHLERDFLHWITFSFDTFYYFINWYKLGNTCIDWYTVHSRITYYMCFVTVPFTLTTICVCCSMLIHISNRCIKLNVCLFVWHIIIYLLHCEWFDLKKSNIVLICAFVSLPKFYINATKPYFSVFIYNFHHPIYIYMLFCQ